MGSVKEPQYKSICLVRLSALGDVCLMVATVKLLQKTFPEAKISWVISDPAYQLVKDLKHIEFIVIKKPRSFSDYKKIYKDLKHREFDVLLAAQASLRVNLLYPAIKAKLKIGFDKKRGRDLQSLFTNRKIEFAKEHLLDSFLRFAYAIGAEKQKDPDCSLTISDKTRVWAKKELDSFSPPYLLINHSASKEERNWSIAGYVAIADIFIKKYRGSVILTGGSNEQEILAGAKVLAAISTKSAKDLTGKTTPQQLTALIAASNCVLSPDTAAVHIANAVNTPVIGLYAVAPSWLSGAYKQLDNMIDKFPQAVELFLKKDPKMCDWKTRVHDIRAMGLVGISEVEKKLHQLLKS